MNSQGGNPDRGLPTTVSSSASTRTYGTLGDKGNRDGFEISFRNALKEHLGGDVSPFIELTFSEAQGRTVAIASCEPCHKPVFVQDGGETDFFVRAGNTSQPLNIKEANEYIRSHGQAGGGGLMIRIVLLQRA